MNHKRKQKRQHDYNKGTKILLASVLSLGIFSFLSFANDSNQSFKAEVNSSTSNTINVNGVDVSLDQNLVDNNDGTYSVSLKTSSSLRHADVSLKDTSAKYGFFKAKSTGDYLFEIWGGNGASGQDTAYSKGGKGGDGAHLYASLQMEKGDYVFYTIGGNGQPTSSPAAGGGANGDGGDHGDAGSYTVGGGGGFTAVYYFDSSSKTYFENNYLQDGELKRTDVIEADRLNKYIMIAGGGGGGGAGNAFSLTNKAIRTPDGGAAGSLNSPSGVLSGSTYKVPGTYYSGSNGYSSSKKLDYVGKGGSNVPGEVNSTFLEWYDGKQPNDWEGAANPDYPGGSGGSGNLRGGAGGAGYAGGSGGIMAGLLIGTDVGGGGGGSSFISSKLKTTLSVNESIFVTNNNESTTGGAVYITHVPDESAYTCLDDITIKGEVSEYFDIVSSNSSKGTLSLDNNKFTVSHATSVPGTAITASTETLLTLTLKTKPDFMGGNDVPLFASDSLTYDYVKDSNNGSFSIALKDKTSYVNLPYQFELTTNSFTAVCPVDGAYTEKKAKDLFVDSNYISQKGTKPYSFIDNVTDYTITDEDGNVYGKEQTLSLTSSKKFFVSFTVTPKAGSKAVVGERLTEKTYTKEANIVIVQRSSNVLNGNTMSYTKTLNYDATNNQYIFSVNVAASGSEYGAKYEYPYASAGTGTLTITETGVYGLHAWGGNGGHGGEGYSGEEGKPGGNGGYYETKVYLNAGDVITYSVGKNGDKGSTSNFALYCGGQGYGGVKSEIYINGTKILVAGGGGGGGGGAANDNKESAGGDCTSLGDGTDGSPSNPSPGTTSCNGKAAGTNYINTSAIDAKNSGHSITDSYRYTKDSYSQSSNNGGAVYIAKLGSNQTLSNYGVKANFTSDFSLNKVEISGATATKSNTNPIVTNIVPTNKVVSDVRYVDFTVTYTLSPNCLGGNDIKLLNSLEINQTDCNGNAYDDAIQVAALDSTDYANVKLDKTVLSQFTLNTNSVDYVQGDDGVDVSSLASGSTTFVPTDKVEIVNYENSIPSTGGKVNPDITTEYVVNYGIRAKDAPTKAIVGPEVTQEVITKTAVVNVYHVVKYNVSHMTIEAQKEEVNGEDCFTFTPGEEYVAKLTPETGWEKPDSVSLIVDGNSCPSYVNINDDGTISIKIPGNVLVSNSTIELTTDAKEKEYTIHYLVSLDVNGILTHDYTVKAKAGDDISSVIDNLIANYPQASAPTYSGYTYTIEYPGGSKPTEMTAADLWINGVYNPNPHTLTVHYVDAGGNKIANDFVDPNTSCYYHKEYSLTPANVSGYAPSYVKVGSMSSSVSDLNAGNPQFSMPDNDLEIYIVYVPINGKVVVNYVCQDNISTLPETVIIDDKAPGESYSIPSPKITGYVASIENVSGQIKADGESFVVTYTPITYTIKFNSDGGTSFEDRTVFYDHEVGYTGDTYETSTYEPLPTPIKVGYDFLGWYINNTRIDAETIYSYDTSLTLLAKWEKKSYTVTICYSYDDDSGVVTPLKDVVLTGLYGDNYTYTHQHITGYTAPDMTSGTYGANNIKVYVTYKINYHDIIIHYVDGSGNTLKADEKVENKKYNTSYEIDSTFSDSNYNAVSAEQFTGSMPDEDLELTFTYKLKNTAVLESNAEVTITPKFGTEFVVGKDNTPNIVVKVDDVTLTEGTDYTVVFVEPFVRDDAGTKYVQIVFKGEYSGTLDKNYEVKAKSIDSSSLDIASISSQTYTGSAIEAKPATVKDGTTTLVENTDYTLSFENNINVGTATVHITFINNYAETPEATVNFTIVPKDISNSVTVTLNKSEFEYTGEEIKAGVTVKDGQKTLVENTDYELFYSNNINAGEAKVTVRFINNYEGSNDAEKKFTITAKEVESSDITIADIANQTYTGKEIKPSPEVKLGDKVLTEGTDFNFIYKDNINKGTATVEVELIGNYSCDEKPSKQFTINAKVADVTHFEFDPDINNYPDEEYTGSAIVPTIKIRDTDNEKVLIEGTDYDLICDDINVGDAEFTIKFKGNYEGTEDITVPFEIVGKDATSDIHIYGVPESVTYNGSQHTPEITVKDGEKVLTKDVDYTVTYGENINAGTGTIEVTFINNYANTEVKEESFTIKPITMNDGDIEIEEVPAHTYDGLPYEPKPEVTYNGTPLVENQDYILHYENNTNVPGGKVIVEFINNYDGNPNKEVSFVINSKDGTSDITVALNQSEFEYTGEEIKAGVTVKDGEKVLVENTDYELIYANNIDAGQAKVTVRFINNYGNTGDIVEYFTITAKEVEASDITIADIDDQTYTSFEIKPAPEVKLGDKVLVEGTDFNFIYKDNINKGTATVEVKLIGNYQSDENPSKQFTINAKVTDDTHFEFEPSLDNYPDEEYTGSPIVPTMKITDIDNEKVLVEGTDYELICEDINVGSAEFTIKFKGNYEGTEDIKVPFEIIGKDASSDIRIYGVPESVTYNGSQHTPEITVKDGEKVLTKDVDYTVSYGENINAGTGTIEVTFINNYSNTETKEESFTINPITMDENELDIEEVPAHTYDGLPYEPKPEVTYDGTLLIENQDYVLSYENNINVPGGKVIVEFINNYDGNPNKEVTFVINPKDASGQITVTLNPTEFTFDGNPCEPTVTVKDGETTLTLGVDYILDYIDNVDAGEATVVIEFINNYDGNEDETAHFTINPLVMDPTKIVIGEIPSHEYDGLPYEPKPEITYDGVLLEEGKDYILSYENNIHVPGGKVIVEFINNYDGSDNQEKEFVIEPKDVPSGGFNIEPDTDNFPPQPYTGDPIKPEIEIKDEDGNPLKEGEDYIIICDDEEVGPAEFIIQFINDYDGNDPITVPFEISPIKPTIVVPDVEYTGQKAEPHPAVILDGKELVEGVDYEVICNDIEAGKATATIHFIGEYLSNPNIDAGFNILPKDAETTKEVSIEIEEVVCTGNEIEPKITVKDGDKVLTEGVDYIVVYTNNTEPGTGHANIFFIGNYKNTDPDVKDFKILANTLDNHKTTGSTATVSLYYEGGFDEDITLEVVAKNRKEATTDYDLSSLGGRFYTTYGSYDIKLYKNGVEIQPSDIDPDCVITLRIAVPSALLGSDIVIVHVHSDEDVTVIRKGDAAGIGTYIIDEEGYLVTLINKLSDYSIIYEAPCIAHYFLLAVAVLDAVLLAALFIIGKKPSKTIGVISTTALIVLTAVAGVFSHCVFCYVLIGINVLLLIANILFFGFYKGNGENEPEQKVVYVEAKPEVKEEVKEEPKEEVKEEVKEEIKEEIPSIEEDLTLKESMAKAKEASGGLEITKASIASFLKENFSGKVLVGDVKPSLTSTNLPLADTHYVLLGENKKCFIYVYEVEGKCFFIVRSNDDVARSVRSKGHKFIKSAFPKTRDYASWYTVLVDDSYKTNDEVYATIKEVINNLFGEPANVVEEVKEDLTLKESMAIAKENTADIVINKESVANYLKENYEGKVLVGDVKPALTSTGLPLADTHYVLLGKNKKCFIYVYDVEGKCFFIVRSDEALAKKIRASGHKFIKSAFPKTRDYASWYTVLVDDSYKSSSEVFEVLDKVIKNLLGENIPDDGEKVSEPEQDLSLKDSMAKAKDALNNVTISKASVASYLADNFKGIVRVGDVKPGLTSTGLPLADTHYSEVNGKEKCFIYVYEIDGKCFFIVRGNEDVARSIRSKGHKFIKSAFPKTRDYASWYTVLVDDSYKTSSEVFETLEFVISNLNGNK